MVEDSILKEVHRVVKGTWRPEPDADSEEVKRLGWKLFRLGLVMLALGLIVAFATQASFSALAESSPWLADQLKPLGLIAVAPGFFAIVLGGYRGILGTDPENDGSSSGTRLAVGVGVGCGSLLVVTVALLALYALAKAFR